MPTKSPTDDPALEFCRLCREGRLFEVQAWLQAGKPSHREHKNVLHTPLGIAIERSNHSLVQVLLQHGVRPTGKHLWQAVRLRRVGIFELLLDHGADVKWINFCDLVYWPEPQIVRLCIERGADTITGYPIAEGLKRATKAFLRLYKEHVDRFPQWKLQADMALYHFARNGSMRGVCLLLWLGANPRSKVPSKYGEDEDLWDTAVCQACANGHAEVLKKFALKPETDDLDDLVRLACIGGHTDVIEHLVGLGANVNAVPPSGETALRSMLWSLEWRLDRDRREGCGRYGYALAHLKRFVELGGKLNPDVPEEIKALRHCLLRLDAYESYELVKFLNSRPFATVEQFHLLLKMPKIKEHLKPRAQALSRLFPALTPYLLGVSKQTVGRKVSQGMRPRNRVPRGTHSKQSPHEATSPKAGLKDTGDPKGR